MRLYTFAADAGRAITDFGSVGLRITPILRIADPAQVVALWLSPGGEIGQHLASGGQLFLVTQGAGWVAGADGAQRPIRAGQAAWWDDGEAHAAGADASGMAALVIEGAALDTLDTLDTLLLSPLP